jgi:hypothetical protein
MHLIKWILPCGEDSNILTEHLLGFLMAPTMTFFLSFATQASYGDTFATTVAADLLMTGCLAHNWGPILTSFPRLEETWKS